MTNEDIAVKLTNHENEIGSLKHRMAAVEGNQKALADLTGSVRELTIEQGHLKSDVGEIKADVKAMLDKPVKRGTIRGTDRHFHRRKHRRPDWRFSAGAGRRCRTEMAGDR